MKKLNYYLHAGILLITFMLFINQFANGQNNIQACKDSYNRALGIYNKGQFERINNDLAVCIKTFVANKVYYRDDTNGRIIVFKVYKLMITAYERIRQGGLALKKKYELFDFYYAKLTRQVVETTLASTKLYAIK